MWLFRIIAKTALVMLALPALGLLAFHGGIGTGLLTVVLVALASFGATVFLFPALVTAGVLSVAAGGLLGGALGARLVQFAIHTGIVAIALGVAAWILPGVALLGFWPTIGAGAILALAGEVLS